ncbi:hypothetical protein IHE33_09650 [Mycetohabitans endofungorum]|uniref:hypothetical protein n=1 Tax=Mycetohabitans endofungorum TaxID=417203 RepID=UPI0030CED453
MAAQTAYKVLVETQTLCARTPLCVENACNDCIGIVLRQSSHEGKRIFVGANRSGSRTRQRDVTLGELAAAPAQLQMCPILFSMNGNTDLLEQGAQQLLPVANGERRCVPQTLEILAQGEQALTLLRTERTRSELFASGEFLLRLFEFAQMFLPLRLKPASDQTVLRIDSLIPALGPLGFIVGPLNAQSPLRKRGVVVGFETFCGTHCCFQTGRLDGLHKRLGGGCIDLQSSDIQAINATAVDDPLVGTMIGWRLVGAAIVG